MKKRSTSQSAFIYLRASIGLLLVLAGVFLALVGIGEFTAQAQQKKNSAMKFPESLVPPMFDCSQIKALNIGMQENLLAGALMVYCGEVNGGSADPDGGPSSFVQEMLAPLLGNTDVDLITGTETSPHITQSETFVAANPDNPNEIMVAYNDSRSAASSNFSGASISTDGGNTFTRITKTTGQSPFANTFGDPVVLYNRPTGTWFTVWIDVGCGSQGMGGYKSTNPSDPNSWTHFCVHTGSFDDRESGWSDTNPASPFYGRMYMSWNDFARGGGALFVRYSTDNGLTWSNEKQLTTSFMRDVQITGDAATGDVYVASMNEFGGGLTTRSNLLFKSTDGGATFTQTYTGPTFNAPGRTSCPNSYFACMYSTTSGGYWRHMGWGQPAALNGVVHYVYDSRNTATGDPGNVFYIRSTDGGVTFGTPVQLNTDTGTRAQWQPNISAASDGSLLAVWYDERETATCTKGDESVPCYRMWARKSLDNGATWLPDEAFSDVVSPLPGQSDPNIIAEYAGDYDYSSSVLATHIHPWTDGRQVVSSASQQDAFVDQETGGGGGNIILTGTARRRGGNWSVLLEWTPSDGGSMDIKRDGSIIHTTTDDGKATNFLGHTRGTFVYQVCETDTGDCSNEATVTVPPAQ